MTKRIFHFNALINAKKKSNRGFGPFIREGIATPCFYTISKDIGCTLKNTLYEKPKEDIRNHLDKE